VRAGDSATLTRGGSITSSVLGAIFDELADAVGNAPAVVQVQNGRRPVSGLVYGDGVVLTTARALDAGTNCGYGATMAKLGAANRTDAVRRAIRRGLVGVS
jgi:hypothetical protein